MPPVQSLKVQAEAPETGMIRMDEGMYGQATIVAILTQGALPPAAQSGHDVQSVVQRYEEGLDQLEHRGADRNLNLAEP